MMDPLSPLTEERLAEGTRILCVREPRFAPVIERHGLPSLRVMPRGVEGLLLTITEQFLSLKAAAVIWARLHQRLSPFVPEVILACPVDELMKLGLSGAKAKSFHAVALAVNEGRFTPRALESLDNETVRQQLVILPGVGPWTAEIYLLAALQRADAWPWGDLALQLAAADLFQFDIRPDRKAMLELGSSFAPFRAIAARLLWSHYRGLKSLKQA